MRSIALAALLLAGCGQTDASAPAANGAAPTAPGEAAQGIECRPAGAAGFARACTVERDDRPEGRVLILRKPYGGFRRLRLTNDGTGVVAADGAERATVTLLPDSRIEVEIGGDRFRLPARIRVR
ncbi:MAG: hypothetical protein JO276_02905 [Sphingomonadaceae bacterium]|nr:hypothetical protein [Sphingomonadaceae bacterium]